jgi:hypothetical protein
MKIGEKMHYLQSITLFNDFFAQNQNFRTFNKSRTFTKIKKTGDAKKKEKRCPISNETSHLKDNFQLIMLQFYFYFIF